MIFSQLVPTCLEGHPLKLGPAIRGPERYGKYDHSYCTKCQVIIEQSNNFPKHTETVIRYYSSEHHQPRPRSFILEMPRRLQKRQRKVQIWHLRGLLGKAWGEKTGNKSCWLLFLGRLLCRLASGQEVGCADQSEQPPSSGWGKLRKLQEYDQTLPVTVGEEVLFQSGWKILYSLEFRLIGLTLLYSIMTKSMMAKETCCSMP